MIDPGSGKPVDYATFSLVPLGSSAPVNGGITDSIGAFLIAGVHAGSYLLLTDFIGYRRALRCAGINVGRGIDRRITDF